jgi:hypothetical protein
VTACEARNRNGERVECPAPARWVGDTWLPYEGEPEGGGGLRIRAAVRACDTHHRQMAPAMIYSALLIASVEEARAYSGNDRIVEWDRGVFLWSPIEGVSDGRAATVRND